MVFLLCWTTFVYYILAFWEWNPNSWLFKFGVMDFAGSGPVHIASGFSALAWSMMLGPRLTENTAATRKRAVVHFKPHNPFLVGLGTVFIWFGWFAFNGASTANLSIRSVYIVVNTNLAACGGGLGWSALEYLHSRKFSILGFCPGIISGLLGITPATGYVPVYVAALVGALTSVCCFYTNKYKYLLSVDEGLDIFAIHGIGGFVGDVLTGVFAAKFVPALDGVTGGASKGGWWDCALLFVINKIPGLHIRAAEDDEIRGLDYKYLHDVDDHSGFDGLHMLHEGVPLSRSSGSPRRESAEPVTKQVSAEPKRD
ncbi:hypothetical protein RB601_008385 [Gaeumannomyces tritici]